MNTNKKKILRFNELCYSVLNTPNGLELLRYLSEEYLNYPVAIPGGHTSHAYWREGQNDIIRRLRTGLKLHASVMGMSKEEKEYDWLPEL